MRVAVLCRDLAPAGAWADPAADLLALAGELAASGPVLLGCSVPPAATPDGVDIVHVETDEDEPGFLHPAQAWSARALDALRRASPERGPDLLLAADLDGQGSVAVQARRTGDPWLVRTAVCIVLGGTRELVEVVDGFVEPGVHARVARDLERYALRFADACLAPSHGVLDAYRALYGAAALARPVVVPPPLPSPSAPAAPDPPDGPLRLLHLGPLARSSGVDLLVEAATGLARDDWTLDLLGEDTATAPLGTSMRAVLESAIAEDRRIRLLDPADGVPVHDVRVVASRWLPSVRPVASALADGRAVLLCAAAGAGEIEERLPVLARAAPGAGGLARAIARLCDQAAAVRAAGATGEHAAALASLSRGDATVALASLVPGEPPPPLAEPPLVSVVVPYHRMAAYIEQAIAGVDAQTYPSLEVIVVNDGSFGVEDAVLARLTCTRPLQVVTTTNAGLAHARNTGVRLARGRYVFPLDPDNWPEPSFVERCVAALEADPSLAYVTAWSSFVDDAGEPIRGGYAPLGPLAGVLAEENVAGDAMAVLRRDVLLRFPYEDVTGIEDWTLYRALGAVGLVGHAVPERLLRYRVRADSMLRVDSLPRLERLRGEQEARLAERALRPGTAPPPEPGTIPLVPSAVDAPDPAEELRLENARLARERLGVSGTAAASTLQRLGARVEELAAAVGRAESARSATDDLRADVVGDLTDLRADVAAELTDLRAEVVALIARLDGVAAELGGDLARVEREAHERNEELAGELRRRDLAEQEAREAALREELACERARVAALEASLGWRAQSRLSGLRAFLLGRRR